MQKDEFTTSSLLITRFLLGQATFGVDAKLVQEVVKMNEITPVHGAPSGVIGIRNLRGRIVTVVDLAAHLNLGTVAGSNEARMLIVDYEGESYGFLVDAVTDAVVVDEQDIYPPPANLKPALTRCLWGIWREDNCLVAILNLNSMYEWEQADSVTTD